MKTTRLKVTGMNDEERVRRAAHMRQAILDAGFDVA